MIPSAERETLHVSHRPACWLDRCLRYGLAIVLAGYLLFAHGCHGEDVDDELFASARMDSEAVTG